MKRPPTVSFCLICLGLALISPFCGMTAISPADLLSPDSPDAHIFWSLRLPRSLAAVLAGAGLAASGLAFQALFRNVLASPFTLGVSSGAAFGASLYFRFAGAASLLGSLGSLGAALSGGLLSLLLVWGLTRSRGGFSTSVMLLSGLVVNFFFSSLVMFLQYWSDANDALRILRWLMGSLTGIERVRLLDLAFVVGAGAMLLARLAPELDLLMLGSELAASRGVEIRTIRRRVLITASLMAAGIVSLTGPIGFVGLMIPHLCRHFFGSRHRLLLPASLALGGAFLAGCDALARVLLAPAELPIGIVTALFGSPFFLWMLFTNRDFHFQMN